MLLDDSDDDAAISSHDWNVKRALKRHQDSIFNFWYFLHDFPMLGVTHPIRAKNTSRTKEISQNRFGAKLLVQGKYK